MPWGLAAAAALGTAGSVASGIIGSNAAKDSAKAIAGGLSDATQTEQGMFNQTQADLQPWVSGGQNALSNLEKLLGLGQGGTGATSPILQMLGIGTPGAPGTGSINPSTFQGSPGYQYQVQQGTNAVTNSAAANGGLGGNALRALQASGQGLANQNWQQYLGNVNTGWQGLVSDVAGVANSGQNAANQLGSFRSNVASQIGGNQIGTGNAIAAGDMGSAEAMAGMIKGIVASLSQGLGAGGGGGGAGGGFGGGAGGSGGSVGSGGIIKLGSYY